MISVTQPYTTDLQKSTAHIAEMTEILQLWELGLSLEELSGRVIERGGLGKTSRVRVNDLVKRAFNQRFLVPDDRPARTARLALSCGVSTQEFRELLFLFCVRTYPVLFDFLVERYWPSVLTGRDVIEGAQIVNFLRDKAGTVRMPDPWSESVLARVGRNLGKMMTDFGLFEDNRSSLRRIRSWEPSDFLVELTLVDAHEAGIGDTGLLAVPEWSAFGMERVQVVERCRRLASSGGAFLFQYSGELAQFSWRVESVEAFLHAR